MSCDRVKDAWDKLPDRLLLRWSKLTDEDVRCPGGSCEYLAVCLQQRYGLGRREALTQVYEFESEL